MIKKRKKKKLCHIHENGRNTLCRQCRWLLEINMCLKGFRQWLRRRLTINLKPPRFYPVRRLCNETNRMELRAMGCAVYKLLNKPGVCTGTTPKLEKALPAVLQEARLSGVCKSVPSGAEVRRQMLVLYEFYLSTRTSLTPWLSDLSLSTLITF